MTDIFLSYSSKDRERVRPIRDALAAFGYEVFWDIETPAGENWDQWIRRHIAKSKVVVVFWTKTSAASVNVQHEAAIARDDSKLIPAQLEIMKAIDFPMGFYTTQAPQLSDWDEKATHAGYASLIKAIRQRFEGTPQQVANIAKQEEAADIADLRRRANAGEASAQVQLGYRYDVGQGVAKDEREALRLYKLAADQGHAVGQYNLGVMHQNGHGVTKDESEALRLYKLAADQGYAPAQSNLGVIYAHGRGVAKDDEEAVRLYKLAADQGYAIAQFNLGVMYQDGLVVARDGSEAPRLYKLAADQGYSPAQFNLGVMYANGRGVAKDDEEAVRLYKLAADQGDASAQNNLATMHANARGGLKRDRSEAMRLWKLAAVGGSKGAQSYLKQQGETW